MDRELRRQNKDSQVSQATQTIKQQSALVKKLTKEVKQGLASRTELEQAVAELTKMGRGVEVLAAESRMLSDWTLASDEQVLPPASKWPYALLVLVALGILWRDQRLPPWK